MDTLHLSYDSRSLRNAGLLVGDAPMAVKHDQGGHSAYVIPLSSFISDSTQYVDAHHLGSACQVSLYPVDDGLGQEASASGIAVKLDYHRLPR
jgi:hypothetical protein